MNKPNKEPIICIACDREKSFSSYFCDRCEELYPRIVLNRWIVESFQIYTGEAS